MQRRQCDRPAPHSDWTSSAQPLSTEAWQTGSASLPTSAIYWACDETISGSFLGGRKPDDSTVIRIMSYLALRLPHPDKIDTAAVARHRRKRYRLHPITVQFYDSLLKLGKPVTLVVYPGEGHELSTASLADQHVRRAIRFFRASRRDESK